jgi:hypothetical protein
MLQLGVIITTNDSSFDRNIGHNTVTMMPFPFTQVLKPMEHNQRPIVPEDVEVVDAWGQLLSCSFPLF